MKFKLKKKGVKILSPNAKTLPAEFTNKVAGADSHIGCRHHTDVCSSGVEKSY